MQLASIPQIEIDLTTKDNAVFIALSAENKKYLDFEALCKKIESSIQMLNPLYHIHVEHEADTKGVIQKSIATIFYDKTLCLSIDTRKAYNRFDGSNYFVEEKTKSYFSRHAKVEESVRIDFYTSRYFEAIEKIVKATIVKHEAQLVYKNNNMPGTANKYKS